MWMNNCGHVKKIHEQKKIWTWMDKKTEKISYIQITIENYTKNTLWIYMLWITTHEHRHIFKILHVDGVHQTKSYKAKCFIYLPIFGSVNSLFSINM